MDAYTTNTFRVPRPAFLIVKHMLVATYLSFMILLRLCLCVARVDIIPIHPYSYIAM